MWRWRRQRTDLGAFTGHQPLGRKGSIVDPSLQATSPCPLPPASCSDNSAPALLSFIFYCALCGGRVDTRGASLTVPAPASRGCQQTLGHPRLSQVWSQGRIAPHRMDSLLELKIIFLIFLLIPMLSIKPLHSLTSLSCSRLGVVFLFIFSLPDCFLLPLTPLPISLPLPEPSTS